MTNKIENEDFKEILENAIKKFYSGKDAKELLSKKGIERSCVFRIGLYINDEMKIKHLNKFKLDSEYNKHFEKTKCIKDETDNKEKLIRPDLIIHKRGHDENNIMAIEFKGYWNKKGMTNDANKLVIFTNSTNGYNYELGVQVILNKKYSEIIYYEGGEEKETKQVPSINEI